MEWMEGKDGWDGRDGDEGGKDMGMELEEGQGPSRSEACEEEETTDKYKEAEGGWKEEELKG